MSTLTSTLPSVSQSVNGSDREIVNATAAVQSPHCVLQIRRAIRTFEQSLAAVATVQFLDRDCNVDASKLRGRALKHLLAEVRHIVDSAEKSIEMRRNGKVSS